MGATIGQKLRALAEEAEESARKAHDLETLIVSEAAAHHVGCLCRLCRYANRYPLWIERLRSEQITAS